jgi:peroxiredoxin
MSTPLRLALVLAAFAVLAASAIYRHMPQGQRIGQPAPAFELPTMTGEALALEQLRGRLLVVNFWATWCAPCVAEMPSLQRLHQALGGEGLTVAGISVDAKAPALERFVREHRLSFPILHDATGTTAAAYGVDGYPETFVIDPDGRILEHYAGPALWHTPEALAHFRALLKPS